jgi:hypothetical protein
VDHDQAAHRDGQAKRNLVMAEFLRPFALTLAFVLSIGLPAVQAVRPAIARSADTPKTSNAALSMKNCDESDVCVQGTQATPSPTPRPSALPASGSLTPPSATPGKNANGGLAQANSGIPVPTATPFNNSGAMNAGIVAFTNPVLGSATGSVTSGGTVTVLGFNFGASPGMLQLEGEFPGRNKAPGGVENLQIQSWTDTQVVAGVPFGLRGAPDQTAQVLLISASGAMSNTLDTKFVATRETVPLLGRDLYGRCGTGTNLDVCGTRVDSVSGAQSATLAGIHFSTCCIAGVSGSDEYEISLKNGWQFARLDLAPDTESDNQLICLGQHPSDTSVCDGTQAGVNGGGLDPVHLLNLIVPGETLLMGVFEDMCVTTEARGLFQPEAQPVAGSSSVDLKIDWHVNANCSPVAYSGTIWITGPAGVPYQ